MLRRREISQKTIKDGLGEEQNGFLLIPSLFPQVLGQVSSSESLMPNELHSVSSSIMKDEGRGHPPGRDMKHTVGPGPVDDVNE